MRVRHMLGVFAIYLLEMSRYYKIVLIFAKFNTQFLACASIDAENDNR